MTPAPAATPKITPIRDTSAQDRSIQPQLSRQRRRRKLLISIASGLLLLLAAGTLAHRWLAAEATIERGRLRIAEVTRGTFVRDIAAQGTVVAAVSPTLFAASAGTVHLLVQAGDAVNRDQVLATVDSPELLSELKQQEATLSSLDIAVARQSIDTRRQLLANEQAKDLANVALQATDRERRRAEEGLRQQVISMRDYERSRDEAAAATVNHKHAIETARLQQESLRFELRTRRLERDRQRLLIEELKRRVQGLEVRSPVDGIVGTINVNERASVTQNAPLLSVVDLSAFEVEYLVPESYADDLGIGMQAEVTSGTRKYLATVSAISPEVQQNQVRGRLRFTREVPQGLRQNQRLSTRILLESRTAVLKVGRGPFLDSMGGRTAYVIRGNIATSTAIQTGATSISEVEILTGLSAGEHIIISDLGELARVPTIRIVD